MVDDIKHLFRCESILMLPCWAESKGARIERAIAMELGLQVVYFNDKFLANLFVNALDDYIKENGANSFRDPDFGMNCLHNLADKFEIDIDNAVKILNEYKAYGC